MTARVFVPLVGANGTAEQMFEAIAGETAPEAHPARLVPQISELFDFGLYKIGQTVREAVTRFIETRRGRVWLGRRNARVAPWYLRISDLQVGRLSDENARSAGLGLAIAALLHSFGRDHGLVFATGEIQFPNGPDAPDIAIGAVDGIRGKLTLVGDYLVQHRAALEGKRLSLLLPRRSVSGQDLAVAEKVTLARLAEEAADVGAELQVTFLETLDDIETAFGPFEMREIVTRQRAAWGGAALAVGVAALAFWISLIRAPIDLQWAALDGVANASDAAQTREATPRRARYDAGSDKLVLLPACFDSQRQPLIVGGETLVMRITSQDASSLANAVRAPRVFIASVSRSADPVILDGSLFRRTAPADGKDTPLDWVIAVPIEPVEDEVRLFVVATRDPSIEISKVLDDLRKHLTGLSGAAVLTSTASFLQDRFSAEVDFQFRVTNDAHLCTS